MSLSRKVNWFAAAKWICWCPQRQWDLFRLDYNPHGVPVVLASIKSLQKCTISVRVLRTAYPRWECWGMRENTDVQNDVSLPPLPQSGTALPLLDVINNIPFILYPWSTSHHFRFLSSISCGTAQGTHPTPPVVEQVLSSAPLCAQHHCPPRRRGRGAATLHAPSPVAGCILSPLHHCPSSKMQSHRAPGTLSV